MLRFKLSIVIGIALAVSSGALPALQTQPPAAACCEGTSGIHWAKDYDAALRRAKVLGKPIMVFMTMNGDATNDEIQRVHMRDRDIVSQSRKFICLVSCPKGAHDQGTGGRTGGAPSTCGRFGTLTCAEHARIEARVRSDLLQSNEVACPQWLFLASDGKTVLLKHVWKLSVAELRDKMKEAVRLADLGVGDGGRDPRFDEASSTARGGNMERRRQALSSLVGMRDERVIAFMGKVAGPRAVRLRRLEAIMAMGESRDERFLPVLLGLLKSKDATTRSHVAVALEKHAESETAEAIMKRIALEKNASVRVNLLRALAACGEESEVRSAVSILLRRGTRSDRVAALWAAAQLTPSEELTKAMAKLLGSSSPTIRAAAYYAIGGQEASAFARRIERRIRSEKNLARTCAAWCLGQLGLEAHGTDEDPEALLLALLPDNHLRAGELEARRRGRR